MFARALHGKLYRKVFLHCFILSFIAGSVNSGGFLACGRFVSHITGFATLFGVDVASFNWVDAFQVLTIPCYFLLGSILAALLVERRKDRPERHRYSSVMGLVALSLFLVVLGGHLAWFGPFGITNNIQVDYLLLALLCGGMGLQNAAIASFSGAVVRTTHLTGITTDLGIGCVRILFNGLPEAEKRRESRVNWLRILSIFGFILGSCVGAVFFLRANYDGFLLPAVLALMIALVSWNEEVLPLTTAEG